MQVLEKEKRVLGAEHPETLTSMNNLTTTYSNQLRAEHPDTLNSIYNLAMIYLYQGLWEEAEKLQVQVLEARKRVIGAEHPDTISSMHNLVRMYKHQ